MSQTVNRSYEKKLKKPRIAPSWEDGLKLLDNVPHGYGWEIDILRNKLLVRLMLFQGLRVGELVGSYDRRHGSLEPLKIGDIDFERRIITLRGKGDKVAEVFLDSETLEMLQKYVNYISRWGKKLVIKPEKQIFNITTRQVHRIVKQSAHKAGLENADRFSPHVLRALSITRMLHEKDLARAKIHARHSSIQTTVIYDRPDQAVKRKDFIDVFEKS